MYSEEYESYADIGEIYTAWIVEENIAVCVEEIRKEAQNLRNQGHLKESWQKYDFIITRLTEANWYEEDIEECKSEKAHIEELITQRKQLAVVFVVAAIVIVSLIIVRHKIKK